jgi:hypothetical protein
MRPWAAILAIGLLVVLGSCQSIRADPPTDVVRVPEIVGVVTRWEPLADDQRRYTIDTGDVVDLNVFSKPDAPRTPRLSETEIRFVDGEGPGIAIVTGSTLLMVGHDPDGTRWYAAAPAPSEPGNTCPFEIQGRGVYRGPNLTLHFSTGLVLPLASQFRWDPDDLDEPFPLDRYDTICLDASGTAISVRIFREI